MRQLFALIFLLPMLAWAQSSLRFRYGPLQVVGRNNS